MLTAKTVHTCKLGIYTAFTLLKMILMDYCYKLAIVLSVFPYLAI